MGQVIAVVSGKGGTGKTAFSTLTGLALAELGQRTLLLDCDIGLRNLDLTLGMSDRAVMDFTDVIAGRAALEDACVQHPTQRSLYLLTSPSNLRGQRVSEEQMRALTGEIRSAFDCCLIDASAGIGNAFRLATSCADRAIVVSNTDATALRDAQRTVMELSRFPNGKLHLVINRVRPRMLRALHQSLDDAIDAAGLPLLGVIPDDETIPLLPNRKSAGLFGRRSPAEDACRNIARRILGERVPLMKI